MTTNPKPHNNNINQKFQQHNKFYNDLITIGFNYHDAQDIVNIVFDTEQQQWKDHIHTLQSFIDYWKKKNNEYSIMNGIIRLRIIRQIILKNSQHFLSYQKPTTTTTNTTTSSDRHGDEEKIIALQRLIRQKKSLKKLREESKQLMKSQGLISPFVPASSHVPDVLIEQHCIQDNDLVIDLGCGDGRILFHLANKKLNIRCIGIELSSIPFQKAIDTLENVTSQQVSSRMQFLQLDFFSEQVTTVLSNTNSPMVIFLYHLPDALQLIVLLLFSTCQPGTRIISYTFPIHLPQELLMDTTIIITPNRAIPVPGILEGGFLYEYWIEPFDDDFKVKCKNMLTKLLSKQ
jgi:hypothetical protein